MEKKKYENPELEIIYFVGELDTLVESGNYDEGNWGDNPPGGDFGDD